MKPTASRLIAAVSALLAIGLIEAARRPRYGGELRWEMRAALRSLDPAEAPGDPAMFAAKEQLVPLVYETLVHFDEHGDPQPWLATSWTHDAARKRWIFAARPNVMLHNGATWSPHGGSIEIPDDRPLAQILRDLARPRNAIAVHGEDGSLVGTGPFRIARWEAEKSVGLVAHEAYWGGRPFIDSVEIRMGRALRDQDLDLDLGKADVIEAQITELRKLRQKGLHVSITEPMETLALVFENPRVPEALREAVALAIDHSAIHNVLLQRQGQISGALLPKWLSGYAFLFSAERNLSRAKQLAGSAGQPLTFAFDRQDSLARSIGERVAVNASEAGITMRSITSAADVKLVRLPVTSRDAWTAIEDIASMLKLTIPEGAANPYEAERALLKGYRVIPLVQLPDAWALSSRVKDWPDLPNVWLDTREKP